MLSFFKKRKLHRELIKSHVFSVGDVYQKKYYGEWQLHNGLKVTIVDISTKRDMLRYTEHFSSVVRECSHKRFLSKYNLVPIEIKAADPYSIHPIIVCKENDETNQNSTTVEVGETAKVVEKVKPVGPKNERFDFWFVEKPLFALLISYGCIIGMVLLSYALSVII
jgi:hypothetical protein